MKKYAVIASLALVALAASILAVPQFSQAQTAPSAAVQMIYPLSRDLGSLISPSAQGTTAAVNSADQGGYNVSHVICAFNQVTITGNPTYSFTIQNKDKASGKYYSLITSAGLTSVSTFPVILAAGDGIATATNLSANLPLAQTWRVQMTNTTSPSTITGTLGCSVQ